MRHICIHGHFYQPPRENPWLEAIEIQDSAAPYHDWNERITVECYAANAASRVLDGQNRIVEILNNYSRISFNFGPTLLSWLEAHATSAYRAIIDADRLSRERFDGHGSAMAQGYSHVIMPLANDRDRESQVVWGLRDFEHRFKRKAEGMWLPETAVDIPTLESLAANGVRFTVLAPRQAKRFRKLGEKSWTTCDNGGIDPRRAYVQKLPSGAEIALFFYDGPISQAVAFEHLLNSGVDFSNRLLGSLPEGESGPQLAHIATDGETFGHHHRHGEMALSYALQRIDEEKLGTVTNYSAFLAEHPPEYEVEIEEGTSWSCYHGVERWRADCGCSSGMHPSWNQRWRKPLREALNWLRDELAPAYESAAGRMLTDPWSARNGYIDVILDRSDASVDQFFQTYGKGTLSPADRSHAIDLLELQRHAMLMFTSCGWFFDDISGIETVQIMQYAGRALQLARDCMGVDFEEEFLRRLEEAPSNVAREGNGRMIYERRVRPTVVDLPAVAAHSAISAMFGEAESGERDVYCYHARQTVEHDLHAGRSRLQIGRIELRSKISGREGFFSYAVVHFGDHVVAGGVGPVEVVGPTESFVSEAETAFKRGGVVELLKLIEDTFGSATYSLGSLFRDQQREIIGRVLESTLDTVRGQYREIYEQHAPLMRFHAGLGIPAPRELVVAAEFVFHEEILEAIDGAPETLARFTELMQEAESDEIPLDEETLAFHAANVITRLAHAWQADPESAERLRALRDTVAAFERFEFEIDREPAQTIFYAMIHSVRQELIAQSKKGVDRSEWLALFEELAGLLRVRLPE